MNDGQGGLADGDLVARRYRVHGRIGAGGMGVVYRATDIRLRREVALKQVGIRDSGNADDARRRTLREAEIAARVHHPRIVSIFDVLDEPGGPLLVLEYLPSRSLGDLVADGDLLTPGVAARAGAQVAEALAAAHAAGIVHRDVKPGNVLAGHDAGSAGPEVQVGPVKLADFGISHVPETSTLTSEGIGTPAYFAPEIARGERPTPASDVYALGATLYAVVQGAPPHGWGTGNPLELIRRIGRDPVPAPTVGGGLGDLLARLTADAPADRPSAGDAAEALWGLADRYEPVHPASTPSAVPSSATAAGAPSEPTRDRPAGRRRPLLLAGGAALVAAAVVAGVLVATSGTPAPGTGSGSGAGTGSGAGSGTGSGAGSGTGAGTGSGTFPSAIPAVRIEDERAADPCSLVQPEALGGFGPTRLIPDEGHLASCQIALDRPGSGPIQIVTRLRPAESTPPDGDQQRLGEALVVRGPAEDDHCQRYIVLADGHQIDIVAGLERSGSGAENPPPDLCAVAETATASAATTVADHGVGQRQPRTDGLWAADACSLLTARDMPFLPAEDASDGYRNFGGWQCEWGDGKDPETDVLVSFDRYTPPEKTGRPVPGTRVFVGDNSGPGRCQAQISERQYLDVNGTPKAEVLRVRAQGPLDEQRLCDRAAALATAANARL